MNIVKTDIPDLIVLEPKVFSDEFFFFYGEFIIRLNLRRQ